MKFSHYCSKEVRLTARSDSSYTLINEEIANLASLRVIGFTFYVSYGVVTCETKLKPQLLRKNCPITLSEGSISQGAQIVFHRPFIVRRASPWVLSVSFRVLRAMPCRILSLPQLEHFLSWVR